MKTVSYKDPYDKVPVVIQIDDDDAEGLEEVIQFLNDNTRIIENLEHKERYHTAYHIEGLVYEGMEYALDEDVESNVARAVPRKRKLSLSVTAIRSLPVSFMLPVHRSV